MAFPAQSSKILIQSFPKPKWSPWPKAIWGKKCFISNHSPPSREAEAESQSRNLEAGSGEETTGESAYWPALCGLLRCFPIHLGHLTKGGSTPISRRCPTGTPTDQSGKAAPHLRLLFQGDPSLYHVTKANQHSRSAGGTTSSWLGNYNASVAKTDFSEFLWKKFDTQRVLFSGGITLLGCLELDWTRLNAVLSQI